MKVISDLLFIAATATESAAATWSTGSILIPTASRENVGFVIVGTDFLTDNPADVPGAGIAIERVKVFLLEENKATEPNMNDPDVIARDEVRCQGDAVNCLVEENYRHKLNGKLVDVDKGYKTARQNIRWGIVSSNAGAAANSYINVAGYIVKFTDAEMAELGQREAFDE